MAQWRKVLVSGSTAHVSTLEIGTAGAVAGTITNRSSVGGSHLSGSFTGSFVGDGSNLDGVTTVFPSTPELGGLDATKFYVNDGSNKFVSGSQLATYVFGEAATGGDVEIASTGAGTIAGRCASSSPPLSAPSANTSSECDPASQLVIHHNWPFHLSSLSYSVLIHLKL